MTRIIGDEVFESHRLITVQVVPTDLRGRAAVPGPVALGGRATRAGYIGPWLPEPLVTQLGGPADPLDEVVRDQDVRMAALAVGDLAVLVGLLHPDAAVIGDGSGKERTARRPIRGADKVARFILGLLERYGPERLDAARMVLVNGDLGMVIPPWPGDAGHPPLAGRVSCFAIRDGQVTAIYDIVNPDKISRTVGP